MTYIIRGGLGAGGPTGGGVLYYDPCTGQYISTPPTPCPPPSTGTPPNGLGNVSPYALNQAANIPFLGPLNPALANATLVFGTGTGVNANSSLPLVSYGGGFTWLSLIILLSAVTFIVLVVLAVA